MEGIDSTTENDKLLLSNLIHEIIVDTWITETTEHQLKYFLPILQSDKTTKKLLLKHPSLKLRMIQQGN